MVYFLLVVSVGGTGTIKGPLVAALILGVFDVAGKYYLPADRRLRHLRADGGPADPLSGRPVRPPRVVGRAMTAPATRVGASAAATTVGRLPDGRWRALEIAFWLIPVACFFLLPNYRVLGSQILITALFAVSLDLILGYAGIVSLGHAAFFGIGAYTAGLLAVHGWHEPLSGLAAAAVVAGIAGYAVSFLVVRGGDLTRLMVTLGIGLMLWEAANKAHSITGGVDGLSGVTIDPILGLFRFDIGRSHRVPVRARRRVRRVRA